MALPQADSVDCPTEPESIIDKRIVKRHNQAVVQWLIKWKNRLAEDATWEFAEKIEEQFPNFDPWGQGSSQAVGIDMIQLAENR